MMKQGKKWLALFLAVMLLGTMLPSTALAAGDEALATSVQFEDMPNDWSTDALKRAVENGLLNGVDGKLLPQGKLTRAQMAAIITRAFGATVEGDLSAFTDVADDWYTPYVAKAYQMGVLNGANGKMNPGANITRQEVFTILARALKLEEASSINVQFHDLDQVASWAKGMVYAMVNAGYVAGSNGYLNPRGEMTRAEFAKLMDNVIQQYISQPGTVTAVAAGNIMINCPGVTLQGVTVRGDLILGDGVGDGDVILDSVTITGRLVVRGGGEHSVIIRGSSSVSNVIVSRVDGAVRVKVENGAQVEVIYIDDGSDYVRIEGTVGELTIAASDIQVTTTGANIQTVAVTGENTTVVVDETSSLGTVSVQAANTQVQVAGTVTSIVTSAPNTKVKGTGKVEKAEAQAGATGASIETPNTTITVSAGVTGVTAAGGEPVSGGSTVVNNSSGTGVTTPTAGGGSGGGYEPPAPIVDTTTVITPYLRVPSSVGTDKGGIMVDLYFDGITIGDLTSLEVSLYRGNTKLVTNTLAFDRINDDTKSSSAITSPFNFGSTGNNQWAWNRGAYPVGNFVTEADMPDKVVITYRKNDVTYTAAKTNVNLSLPFMADNTVIKLIDPYIMSPKKDANGELDLGGVAVDVYLKDGLVISDLQYLKVSLYRDDVELVSNSLSYERISDGTKASYVVTCPFRFGHQATSQSSWDRGAYGIGDSLGVEDLPTKVVIEFAKGGQLFRFVKDIPSLENDLNNYVLALRWDGTVPAERPATMKAPENGVQEIHTAAEFAWIMSQANMFADGVTKVKLMADINLCHENWTPSTALVGPATNVFDGNGHTIYNLKVENEKYAALFIHFGINKPAIKNLTIDGAVVEATGAKSYAAVLSAADEWRGAAMENVTVKNATVTATKYIGALTAYIGGGGGSSGMDIKNCTVENVTLIAKEMLEDGGAVDKPHMGGLVGLSNEGTISGNTVTNLTMIHLPAEGKDAVESERIGTLVGTAQADVRIAFDNTVTNATYNGASFDTIAGLDRRAKKVMNTTRGTFHSTIQEAVTGAENGDTIQISAGSYAGDVEINKSLILAGAGNQTIVQGTIIVKADHVSLVNFQILRTEAGQIGIQIPNTQGKNSIFCPRTGFHMNGISLISQASGNDMSNANRSEGLMVGRGVNLTDSSIENCLFEGWSVGIYIAQDGGGRSATANNRDASSTANINITASIFRNNMGKAIYAEKYSEATIDGCIFENNGTLSGYKNGAAIDINIKGYAADGDEEAQTSKNITVSNCTFAGNGVGSELGAALMVKARGTGNDNADYSGRPARLDGVVIINNTFAGNERGIVFGEPGMNNTTPVNVTLSSNVFSENANGNIVNHTTNEEIQVDGV